MPYNIPTVTTNDISFGPAVLYLGTSGTTPLVDVGSISEDGVSLEITSEKKYISQGNPRLNIYAFTQAQGAMVKVSSIEWDFTNLTYAMGAGETASPGGGLTTFKYGGDPLATLVALHIQHYMAVSGNTMNVKVWTAQSDAGVSVQFGQDEHSFEYSWTAIRSTTNWGGDSLGEKVQLLEISRQA
jgi:hypothetical protein